MPRKSLRPHLNQIRAWARQGRTDAWVAHQLEVSVRDIEQFKRQNDLAGDDNGDGAAAEFEEIDLRAEDDALIAAELEEAEAEAERQAQREAAEAEAERALAEAAEKDDGDDEEESGEGAAPRRRSRRGGRRRSGARTAPLEGTFDHGEEGFGLWLDPAIQDNPVYAEHWAGHRPVEVAVEEDRIVIRRIGGDDEE
jgi:hypothetical protein